jgi:hypothetical protein
MVKQNFSCNGHKNSFSDAKNVVFIERKAHLHVYLHSITVYSDRKIKNLIANYSQFCDNLNDLM